MSPALEACVSNEYCYSYWPSVWYKVLVLKALLVFVLISFRWKLEHLSQNNDYRWLDSPPINVSSLISKVAPSFIREGEFYQTK